MVHKCRKVNPLPSTKLGLSEVYFWPRLVQAPCLNFHEHSFGDKMQCSHDKVLLAPEVAKQERELADLYSNRNIKVRLSEYLELLWSIISTKTRHILTSLYSKCQRTFGENSISSYSTLMWTKHSKEQRQLKRGSYEEINISDKK